MRKRDLLLGGLAFAVPVAARAAERTVVLELFTSQGCSSCPPADALLGELTRRPEVIALAWHVDYWNNLGWRDPYAQRSWTDRQRRYADQLRDEVYTPALVVNGSTMIVGSDRSAVYATIRQMTDLPLRVALRRTDRGLEAAIDPLPAGATAAVVIYDPENATNVGAGENSGRRLREYRIVRDLRTLDAAGGRLIKLPNVSVAQGAALLVQDGKGQILGAADVRPG